MCGISGHVAAGESALDAKLVSDLVESQWRRGPDFQAIEKTPHALLGHNRLKIIDLSEQSNQPKWDAAHTCCVVFNGEIYNYRELRDELSALGHAFTTSGDVEVLLAAYRQWGAEACSRFNGMFAFAIWDEPKGELLLARDRFGVKPLFYHEDGIGLAFASSTKVLARRFGLKPNLGYLERGLRLGVYEDDGDVCAYEDLRALPAGCVLVGRLESNRLMTTVRRFYDLHAEVERRREESAGADEATLLARLQSTLRSAVDFRTRADVKVGVSLSGGLDSASVAALLAQGRTDVQGITYGSPEDSNSEGPVVRELAAMIGVQPIYVQASADEACRAIESVIEAQDAPFGSGSILAQNFVFQRAKEEGLTVMMGGQGGDEALMGYRKYLLFRMQDLRRRGRHMAAVSYAGSLVPTLLAERRSARVYMDRRRAYAASQTVEGISLVEAPVPLQISFEVGDQLWERQAKDVLVTSLPTLLRYEDRNSMNHSIESRLPFLDYRMIELGLALPTELKLRRGYGKWALRQAMSGLLPDSVRLARYKIGFEVAIENWIRNGLGDRLRRLLLEREASFGRYLPRPLAVHAEFSDERLVRRRRTFQEAISLIWLGGAA